MQLLRPHLKMILLIGITTLLAACSSGGGDGNDDALEFFDNF